APTLAPVTNCNLGDVADFERTNGFSYGCWVNIPKPKEFGTLIARMDQTNDYRGWDLAQTGKKIAVHIVSKWPVDALKVSTKEEVLKPGTWQHVFMTYDGSSKAKGLKLFVDGAAVPLATDNDTLTNSIRTTESL